jgi:hypothetical protein
MKTVAACVGSGWVVVALALTGACSSSSSVGNPDAGETPDAKGKADGGKDGSAKDGGAKEAAADVQAATCNGLDAGFSGLSFPMACEACVSAHCCSQALACAATSGCKEIEQCAATCVAAGTAPQTCATMCLSPDGGAMIGSLNAPQQAAYTLDLCLVSSCSGECG